MKNFLLIIVFFFLINGTVLSQSSTEYSVPASLKVETSTSTHVDYGFFFPIGWSRHGKFAYTIQHANLAGEPFHYHTLIQDTVTGSTLWEYGIDIDTETVDWDQIPDDMSGELAGLWKYVAWPEAEEQITDKLGEHGIQQDDFSLKPLLLGDAFWIVGDSLSLIPSIEYGGMLEGFDCVSQYSLYMYSVSKGIKRIYHHVYKEPPYLNRSVQDCPMGIELKGFLQSPFENRIVVILNPAELKEP